MHRLRKTSSYGTHRFESHTKDSVRRASVAGVPESAVGKPKYGSRMLLWRGDRPHTTASSGDATATALSTNAAEKRRSNVALTFRTYTETRCGPLDRTSTACCRASGSNKSSVPRLSKSSCEVGKRSSRQSASSYRLSRNKPSIGTDAYYLHQMKEVLYEFKSSTMRSSPTKIVHDYLYLGSYWDANNAAYLRRLGINHVLNCAGTRRNAELCPYQIDTGILWYMGIPAVDKESYDILQHVQETNSFINEARLRGGKVLVHCVMGVNRSGFIVAAYLIGVLKMSLMAAVKVLKDQRCTVLYNTGFQRQLVWYARRKGLL
ncbi:hypothetical protein LSH36_995g00011 [Paralvinella palmiformis]|uniref:protein-tyrosine-phosphatase n=1 Tax=Paralvinella palmiformis TaxID=53620 RepID=A0AAD9IW97_9ANNE|nr:hypothetical protein LSH36_995g00011 [Paralvinella palmiformis]